MLRSTYRIQPFKNKLKNKSKRNANWILFSSLVLGVLPFFVWTFACSLQKLPLQIGSLIQGLCETVLELQVTRGTQAFWFRYWQIVLIFWSKMSVSLNISGLYSKFWIIRKACFQLQMCLFVFIAVENILKLWFENSLKQSSKRQI